MTQAPAIGTMVRATLPIGDEVAGPVVEIHANGTVTIEDPFAADSEGSNLWTVPVDAVTPMGSQAIERYRQDLANFGLEKR